MDRKAIESAIRIGEERLRRQRDAIAATEAQLDLFRKALAEPRPKS